MELLKEKLWKAYLIKHRDLFKPLMEDYNKGKKRIQEITESASQEATAWQEVINIFNRRFSVPFKVSIENKQDVILRRVTPNIKFQFVDEDCTPVSVERNDLIDVLSNGEKRALYILNIIFEFEARKTAGLKTIFVIDDIADSFDYKNKYAIVEYISDILIEGDFYQIILTHNYDFYRTVWKRLDLGGANYHIVKDSNQVVLEKDTIYKDPFTKWKSNSENPNKSEMLVAMIPFVRNLAEYCGCENEEKKLTSLLHIKSDTETITFRDLEVVFNKILHGPKTLNLPNHSSLVKTKIYDLAATFCRETEISIELEKKIVLSIAIRLKAEEFLIKKIADSNFVNSLKSNQTGKLIKKYKNLCASDISEREKVQIIERVNLMTPENIHINSFMYEPLLDMSSDHLRGLYKDICAL